MCFWVVINNVMCEVSFNSYNIKELDFLEQIAAIIMAANKGC